MRYCYILLLVALLGGCSQLQQPPVPAFDPQAAASLETWTADGRLGVRLPHDSFSAGMTWQQTGDDYRIAIKGPLGQGGLRIEGNRTGVNLERSGDDNVYRADTPEALMQKLLGWHLPLSQARFWIRGLPDPATASSPLPSPAQGFIQSGWKVEYQRFAQSGLRVLPEKLRLQHQELRLTVIISDWET